MGRPPLPVKTRLTAVRLDVGLAERIDALVGSYQRAAFIRRVVRRAVEREERRLAKASTAKPGRTRAES